MLLQLSEQISRTLKSCDKGSLPGDDFMSYHHPLWTLPTCHSFLAAVPPCSHVFKGNPNNPQKALCIDRQTLVNKGGNSKEPAS